MANSKRVIIFCTILFNLSVNSIGQQFTGFKNTDAQKKLETNFDNQLSAKELAKILS